MSTGIKVCMSRATAYLILIAIVLSWYAGVLVNAVYTTIVRQSTSQPRHFYLSIYKGRLDLRFTDLLCIGPRYSRLSSDRSLTSISRKILRLL